MPPFRKNHETLYVFTYLCVFLRKVCLEHATFSKESREIYFFTYFHVFLRKVCLEHATFSEESRKMCISCVFLWILRDRPRISLSESYIGTEIRGSGPHWGRTTGGGEGETAHTTRLVTPKGSADIFLYCSEQCSEWDCSACCSVPA